MTTIAYKDGYLAADKLNCHRSGNGAITKIRKIHGELVGISGATILSQLLFAWAEGGWKEKEMPLAQADKDTYATIIRITKDKQILVYENSATPWINEKLIYAIGAGSEFAIGAMADTPTSKGRTAAEAVLIACEWSPLSGGGIDVITFDDQPVRRKK